MTSQTDVIAVLRGTRDQIEAGWCQKAFATPEGVCLSRALSNAAKAHLGLTDAERPEYEQDFVELFTAATRAIRANMPDGFYGLVQFNDNHHTTKDDVLMVMEKTLAELGGLVSV